MESTRQYFAYSAQGSVSWRPENWLIGFYGAGRYGRLSFDHSTNGDGADERYLTVSAGAESPFGFRGSLPFAFYRLGFVHTFQPHFVNPDALMISFDVNIGRF